METYSSTQISWHNQKTEQPLIVFDDQTAPESVVLEWTRGLSNRDSSSSTCSTGADDWQVGRQRLYLTLRSGQTPFDVVLLYEGANLWIYSYSNDFVYTARIFSWHEITQRDVCFGRIICLYAFVHLVGRPCKISGPSCSNEDCFLPLHLSPLDLIVQLCSLWVKLCEAFPKSPNMLPDSTRCHFCCLTKWQLWALESVLVPVPLASRLCDRGTGVYSGQTDLWCQMEWHPCWHLPWK